MQEVKQIELVFENCEYITFLPEQIGTFCALILLLR